MCCTSILFMIFLVGSIEKNIPIACDTFVRYMYINKKWHILETNYFCIGITKKSLDVSTLVAHKN